MSESEIVFFLEVSQRSSETKNHIIINGRQNSHRNNQTVMAPMEESKINVQHGQLQANRNRTGATITTKILEIE